MTPTDATPTIRTLLAAFETARKAGTVLRKLMEAEI